MIWGQIKNFRKYMTVGGEILWAIMKHRRRSGKSISEAAKDIGEYFKKHNLKFRDLTEI